ncbi:TatD family hydrolase [Permianibacter sp. IMCC34836]|uniref:TatD family hydrolase n=1 Tax=Permianibacter fluminis TaxID=2738515 RepID=UPI0015527CF8|nr:TatD family hydrolase [Permianibacter fluminis]
MQLIDSHCHLDYPPLSDDADALLARCAAEGISRIVVPATTAARWPALVAFVRSRPMLALALGLHPIYLDEHGPAQIADLATWVQRERPCAIGEIGLDYFVETLDRERQQQLFEAQLAVAEQAHLPVILHVRRSHDATIATLKRRKFTQGGIVHAFAGSAEQAREFIKLGFKLGFGGVMTYDSATRVRKLAASLPLDAIVLETDAPDMKPADWPEPHNSPLALVGNFRALCALRPEPAEQIAAVTSANARQALRL